MKRLLLLCLLIGLTLSIPIITNGQKVIKIDCNVPSFLPDQTWSIDPSSKTGKLDYNPLTIKLINLSGKRSSVKTAILAERIKNDACPAQVLDYLLAHQELIPAEWQGKSIIFTGTLYHDATGIEVYRTMYYHDGAWDWGRAYPDEIYDDCAAIVIN